MVTKYTQFSQETISLSLFHKKLRFHPSTYSIGMEAQRFHICEFVRPLPCYNTGEMGRLILQSPQTTHQVLSFKQLSTLLKLFNMALWFMEQRFTDTGTIILKLYSKSFQLNAQPQEWTSFSWTAEVLFLAVDFCHSFHHPQELIYELQCLEWKYP